MASVRHTHTCLECGQEWDCDENPCRKADYAQCPHCSGEDRHSERPVSKVPAIASSLLLTLAVLGDWSYGFFTVLKLVVCLSAIYLAAQAASMGKIRWVWIMGGVALLFNPLVPLYMARSTWQVFDLVTTILFLISLRVFHRAKKGSDKAAKVVMRKVVDAAGPLYLFCLFAALVYTGFRSGWTPMIVWAILFFVVAAALAIYKDKKGLMSHEESGLSLLVFFLLMGSWVAIQWVESSSEVDKQVTEHLVMESMGGGRLIELDDGSLWEIAPIDRVNTALWLATEEVIVTESKNPTYPYELLNEDTGHLVEAKLLSR